MGLTTGIGWSDATWNPWVGCHKISPACANCLVPDTPILGADMKWRPIGEVEVGDTLAGFDEQALGDGTRKTRPAVVEGILRSRSQTMRIVTDSGDIFTTAEHRWLAHHVSNWTRTRGLRAGVSQLRDIGLWKSPGESIDYRAGYIAGMTKGDGTFRFAPGSPNTPATQLHWRVALADPEPLGRLVSFLATWGIESNIRPFDGGGLSHHKPMQKIEIRSKGPLSVIYGLTQDCESRDWKRGYVAGFFDAEGSFNSNLRMSQVAIEPLQKIVSFCREWGFEFKIENNHGNRRASTVKLVGTLKDKARFFGVFQPSIGRKLGDIWNRTMKSDPSRVLAIEPGPATEVIDIQTSTGTFYAGGLATHNCYMFREMRRFKRDPSFVQKTKDVFSLPLKKDNKGNWKIPDGKRVFTASWSDFFHEDADEWRDEAWAIIRQRPGLTFQIVTKRVGNIAARLPKDWGDGYPNCWLIATVESQEYAEKRLPQFLKVPAALHGVSAEPLLGPLRLRSVSLPGGEILDTLTGQVFDTNFVEVGQWPHNLGWVIVGGESGPPEPGQTIRATHPDWNRMLLRATREANVPLFAKQNGDWLGIGDYSPFVHGSEAQYESMALYPDGTIGQTGERRVSLPMLMYRVGNDKSGNEIDGEVYQEFPGDVVRGGAV